VRARVRHRSSAGRLAYCEVTCVRRDRGWAGLVSGSACPADPHSSWLGEMGLLAAPDVQGFANVFCA
jgi:hypothetical protein